MKRALQFSKARATLVWNKKYNSRKCAPQLYEVSAPILGNARHRNRATIVRVKRFNEIVFFESNELRLIVEVTSLTREKLIFFLQELFARQAKGRIC